MARVLIVANDTLGGRTLIDAVRARHDQGDAEFFVIAPQNRPKSGAVIYDEAVRDAAQNRVDRTIQQLRDAGISASGEVMDPDPYTAVTDAIGEWKIDEVIISTFPETRSGWLRRDLPDRVRDDTGLPVTHVVVDPAAERQELTHTLVVANQTVGGGRLYDLLRSKAADSKHVFTVVVPQGGGHGWHAHQARSRLAHLLKSLQKEGIEATGGIGDPDPYTAVMNALQFYRVDDIVISTLPESKSGWLRADLIERVRRSAHVPVEHVFGTEAPTEAEPR
jgi:hypothetical protein